MIIMIAIQT